MNNKKDTIQIIGALMKHPMYLSQVDKYSLSIDDFTGRFEKYIFDAIKGLYSSGAERITPIDVENYLSTSEVAKAVFNQSNGIEYLQDAEDLTQEENFDYYYQHLKKINLINSLKKIGIDTSDFYCEDLTRLESSEINYNFEKLSVHDIIDGVKKKILSLERDFTQNDTTETTDIFDNFEEMFEEMSLGQDIGLPLQGNILNEVMSGAQLGKLCIRSGSSGLGKTRNMVGDACYLAFPIRYNPELCMWEQSGNSEKILYICTEQTKKEIQEMVLAYITGINQANFKYSRFSERECTIIAQAKEIIKHYKDNFQLVVMPNPCNELIKTIIRENCIIHDIHYVFYDYIFIGPALLKEFKGFALRNDELLLILSTTLKDLAVELNVFIMTATQLNAKGDDNSELRNEASLAGGRATINKADYGFIMARPTKEELQIFGELSIRMNKEPNVVMDVFKVRAGQWTQVRIWSVFDLGTLRREDIIMTDSRFNVIQYDPAYTYLSHWDDENYSGLINDVNKLNEGLGIKCPKDISNLLLVDCKKNK